MVESSTNHHVSVLYPLIYQLLGIYPLKSPYDSWLNPEKMIMVKNHPPTIIHRRYSNYISRFSWLNPEKKIIVNNHPPRFSQPLRVFFKALVQGSPRGLRLGLRGARVGRVLRCRSTRGDSTRRELTGNPLG